MARRIRLTGRSALRRRVRAPAQSFPGGSMNMQQTVLAAAAVLSLAAPLALSLIGDARAATEPRKPTVVTIYSDYV